MEFFTSSSKRIRKVTSFVLLSVCQMWFRVFFNSKIDLFIAAVDFYFKHKILPFSAFFISTTSWNLSVR